MLVELVDIGSGKFASTDALCEEDIEFMESTILYVVRTSETVEWRY